MDPAPLGAVDGPSDDECSAADLDAVLRTPQPSDDESSAADLDAVLSVPRRLRVRRASSGNLDDPTVLRATLGKPCGCKIRGGCFTQFQRHSDFEELRRFREELRSLHKLDQDRVDTQHEQCVFSLSISHHQFSTNRHCFVGYSLVTAMSVFMIISVRGAQVHDQLRQQLSSDESAWTFLGKPVCLKAWENLVGIGHCSLCPVNFLWEFSWIFWHWLKWRVLEFLSKFGQLSDAGLVHVRLWEVQQIESICSQR